jgi:hypothetical protein
MTSTTEIKNMLLTVTCICDHSGIIAEQMLPGLLTCSGCERRELFKRADAWPVTPPANPLPKNALSVAANKTKRREHIDTRAATDPQLRHSLTNAPGKAKLNESVDA